MATRRVRKNFRVSLPANVLVEISALDMTDAIRQAKAYEGMEIPITVVPPPTSAMNQQTKVSISKYVHGTDHMEEIV